MLSAKYLLSGQIKKVQFLRLKFYFWTRDILLATRDNLPATRDTRQLYTLDNMKAWNYINVRNQETAKEYSTIVQIIVKDDLWKGIAWRSVNDKMTCYPVSDEKTV